MQNMVYFKSRYLFSRLLELSCTIVSFNHVIPSQREGIEVVFQEAEEEHHYGSPPKLSLF